MPAACNASTSSSGSDMLITVRKASVFIPRLAICGTLFFAVSQLNHAADIDNAILTKIPQRIEHFIDEQTIAGAVTLVAHDNDIVEFHALGLAIRSSSRKCSSTWRKKESSHCVIPSSSICRNLRTSTSQQMWDQRRLASACPTIPSPFGTF